MQIGFLLFEIGLFLFFCYGVITWGHGITQ